MCFVLKTVLLLVNTGNPANFDGPWLFCGCGCFVMKTVLLHVNTGNAANFASHRCFVLKAVLLPVNTANAANFAGPRLFGGCGCFVLKTELLLVNTGNTGNFAGPGFLVFVGVCAEDRTFACDHRQRREFCPFRAFLVVAGVLY